MNGGGVHVGEEEDDGEALTVRQLCHGGAFGGEDNEAELRVEGIEEVDSRRGRTSRTELGGSNDNGGASEPREAGRERGRRRERVQPREGDEGSSPVCFAAPASLWPCMPATRCGRPDGDQPPAFVCTGVGAERGGAGLRSGLRSRALGPLGTVLPLHFPSFFFEISKFISNSFFIILKALSRVAPKIKVVQNKILYNFALRCNSRIQIDFELQIKISSRFNKSILGEIL